MTVLNSEFETADMRLLTEGETGDIGGGAISLGTWFTKLVWQIQNAPENSELIGCSDDMSTCTWQSK